jgi:hypothetical protein
MSMCPLIFCKVRMSTRLDMRVSGAAPAAAGGGCRRGRRWRR